MYKAHMGDVLIERQRSTTAHLNPFNHPEIPDTTIITNLEKVLVRNNNYIWKRKEASFSSFSPLPLCGQKTQMASGEPPTRFGCRLAENALVCGPRLPCHAYQSFFFEVDPNIISQLNCQRLWAEGSIFSSAEPALPTSPVIGSYPPYQSCHWLSSSVHASTNALGSTIWNHGTVFLLPRFLMQFTLGGEGRFSESSWGQL